MNVVAVRERRWSRVPRWAYPAAAVVLAGAIAGGVALAGGHNKKNAVNLTAQAWGSTSACSLIRTPTIQLQSSAGTVTGNLTQSSAYTFRDRECGWQVAGNSFNAGIEVFETDPSTIPNGGWGWTSTPTPLPGIGNQGYIGESNTVGLSDFGDSIAVAYGTRAFVLAFSFGDRPLNPPAGQTADQVQDQVLETLGRSIVSAFPANSK